MADQNVQQIYAANPKTTSPAGSLFYVGWNTGIEVDDAAILAENVLPALAAVAGTVTFAGSVSAANLSGTNTGDSRAPFTRTAVKTSAYTTAPGELVPCSTVSAGFTVTLPSAPPDRSQICVRHAVQGGTNAVTVACGGTDVLEIASGATSRSLPLPGQAVWLQYQASTGIWTTVADGLTLASLDARFDAAGSASSAAAAAQAYAVQRANHTGTQPWSTLTGTPSTLSGYGITNGVTNTTTVNGMPLSSNVVVTTITGNAGTATALQTARTINGVNFDGTANITVTAAAGTLTGTVLASNVVTSSLTSAAGGTFGTAAYLTAGAANGAATLDGTGKLTASQIPASLIGAVVYIGVWNASTNSPTLTSGTGTKGNYYKVSVAGSTNLDGITQWNVGDTAIFDGTTWDKLDGIANEVISFNGRYGVIVPASGDYAFAQIGSKPTTLAGYGITDGVTNTTTVNGMPLSSNVTVTTITGNAGTATALQTARAINGVSFDGTANITITSAANTLTGTTLASNVVNSSLTSVGTLTSLTVSGTITGTVTGNATTATALQTARLIYGNSFNGTADLSQVISSAYGGTGSGFTKLTGPFGTEKTFTLPNASANILTDNAPVTVAQGGTGLGSGTAGQLPYFTSSSAMGTTAQLVYAASGSLLKVSAGAAGDVPITAKGFSGQTGSLQEWQNSSGNRQLSVSASGFLSFYDTTGAYLLGQFVPTVNPTGSLVYAINHPSYIGIAIKGNTSQTGALMQFQDAAGTVLTAINNLGAFTGNAATASALQTARNINGVAFDGTQAIVVTAAAGTLTGTTLAANVVNSSLTSVGTLTGLTVTGTITGSVTGNAATATALQTARTINGVSFDGTSNITVTAAAGTLTGTTLASNVVASSLTSVGTLSSLAVTATITGSVSGNAGTATTLQTARTINGVNFDGSANITVTAAAGTLTGTTLASNVVASSLTSVGTLTGLTVSGTISGSISGNAATATALQTARTINGVSFDGTSNITVTAAAGTLTGTALAANVVSSSLTSVGTLSGLTVTGTIAGSISGNAGTATALQNARSVYGNAFDGTAALTQVISSAYGGTGNGFTKFSGPFGSEKTFTLPNASAAVLTDNALVTVAQGGTGLGSGTAGQFPYFASSSAMGTTGLLAYGTSGAILKAAAGAVGDVPLTAKGFASQTGNLTEWQGSTGTVLSAVTAAGAFTGNAATATALQAARTINGVAFDGTSNITVTAAAGTLTGATLAANVVNSSLTSVGTLTSLTVSGTITGSVSGNAATATALQTARLINGVAFDGTANITVPAAAGTLTGTTLASNVVNSSLTSVGTLTGLTVTAAIAGSVTGTASALQTARTINGVYFDGTANVTVPAAAGTLTGTTIASSVVNSSLTSVGTLTGLTVTGTIVGSVSGNAATATALQTPRAINGVNFDGTSAITVTAAAGTLTGATLASNVLASSLTSVGTLSALTVTGTLTASSQVTTPDVTGTTAPNGDLVLSINGGGAIFDGPSLYINTVAGGYATASAIDCGLWVNGTHSFLPAVIFQGLSGQSADLTQWQNSSGTVLSGVQFTGVPYAYGAGAITSNTAFGTGVLAANTTGYVNAGFGRTALNANTTGFANTAIGADALLANTTGSYNTAVGGAPLYVNTTGGFNTGVGYLSLGSNTTGSDNTAIGYYAGYANTTGTNNTFLGYYAGNSSSAALTNATAIGYNAQVTASNSLVLGNGANVGIGNTAPGFMLSMGTNTAVSTATPDTLSMGGTFSNTAGANIKLRLFYNGSVTFGIGVSNYQQDYLVDSASNHVFYVGSERLRIGSSSNPITLTGGSSGSVVQVVKGVSSQTANLTQWQDSSSTVLASVGSAGNIATGAVYSSTGDVPPIATTTTNTCDRIRLYGSGDNAHRYGFGIQGGTLVAYFDSADPTYKFSWRGAAASGDPSTGTEVAYLNGGGAFFQTLNVASYVGHTIRGASSQSGNLSEWQNSSGTALAKVDYTGKLFVPNFQMSTGAASGYYLRSDASGNASWATVTGEVISSTTLTTMTGVVYGNGSTLNANSNLVTNGSGTLTVGTSLVTPNITGTASLPNGDILVYINGGSAIFNAGSLIINNTAGAYNIATTIDCGMWVNGTHSFLPAVIFQGLSGQSADIQQWQNSSGTVLSAITYLGGFTGNAATATALQTARTINGVSFDGTANITVTAAAGTLTGTALASNVVSSSLTSVGTLSGLTVTGTITGSITGNAGTATALQTARTIYGNSFDGTANLSQIIASTYGGTGNGFTKFSGPATAEKTFTLPNASAAILTDNALVTVAQGGTGLGSGATGRFPYFTSSSAMGTTAQLIYGTSGAILTASAGAVGDVPITVKGAASQTGDLAQWQNSSSTVLTAVKSDGQLQFTDAGTYTNGITYTAPGGNVSFKTIASIGGGQDFVVTSGGRFRLNTYTLGVNLISAYGEGCFLDMRGGQAGFSGFQNFQLLTSNNDIQIFDCGLNKNTTIRSYNDGRSVVVQANASQTSDLQQWQNSGGTVLAKVAASGAVSSFDFRGNNTNGNPSVSISGYYAAYPTLGFNSYQGTTNYYVAGETGYLSILQFDTGSGDLIYYTAGSTAQGANGSMVARTTIAQTGAVKVTSTASTVPLTVKGAASQTANLQEWQNSAGGLTNAVNPNGQFEWWGTTSTTNRQVGFTTAAWLNATDATRTSKLSTILNCYTGANTAYEITATGNGITHDAYVGNSTFYTVHLASDSSFVAGDGTRNLLAAYANNGLADYHLNVGGRTSVQNYAAGEVTLGVKGAASQTGRLQEWQDSSGNMLAYVGANGQIFINPNSLSAVPVIARGGYGATVAAISLAQVSSNVATITTTAAHGFSAGQTVVVNDVTNSYFSGTYTIVSVPTTTTFTYTLTHADTSSLGDSGTATVTATNSTADLQQWQNYGGTVLSRVDYAGKLFVPSIQISGGAANGYYLRSDASGNAAWATVTGEVISNTTLTTLTGMVYGNGTTLNGDANITTNGAGSLTVASGAVGAVPLTVKGIASQTADLTQWKNASAAVLAGVQANGVPYAYGGGGSGTSNIAYGVNALSSNTGGFVCTAFGSTALQSNTTGGYNNAFGYAALQANTTGSENTAIGYTAVASNTTGTSNIGIGRSSVGANTTGGSNIGIGYAAVSSNVSGSSNVGVGYVALALTTASENVGVGYFAMFNNASGSGNVAVGPFAGNANTTGSNNTYIGSRAGYSSSASITNATAIGYNSQVTASNALILGSGVNVGIGNTAPPFLLSLGGLSNTASTTPDTLSLGGTYSSTAGANLKLRMYWDGSVAYGFGVSANHLDYVVAADSSHVFYVGSNERFRISTTGTTTTTTSSAGSVVEVIQGASGQYVDLTQWQNNSGTVLAKVNSAGNLSLESASATITLSSGGNYIQRSNVDGHVDFFSQNYAFAGWVFNNTAGNTLTVPLTVKGAASQTGNLQQWQDSTGTVLASIDAAGIPYFVNASAGGNVRIVKKSLNAGTDIINSDNGNFAFKNDYTSNYCGVGANQYYWYPSAGVVAGVWGANDGPGGAVLAKNYQYAFRSTATTNMGGNTAPDTGITCSSAGVIKITDGSSGYGGLLASSVGIGTGSPTSPLHVVSTAAGTVVSVLKGAASQTADFTQWQNSGSTVLAAVGAAGNISTTADYSSAGDTAPLFVSHGGTGDRIRLYGSGNTGSRYGFGIQGGTLVAYIDGTVANYKFSWRAATNSGDPTTGTEMAYLNAGGAFYQTLNTPSYVGHTIKGASSQSGNLSEWQDAAATVLSKVDYTGKLFVPNLQMSTGAANGYYLRSDASGNASWATVTGEVISNTTLTTLNGMVYGNGTTLNGDANITTNGAGSLTVVSGAAGTVPLTVKAYSGQTTDLIKFVDSGTTQIAGLRGTSLGSVLHAGDDNHSIWFRIGYDATSDVTEYREYGVMKFFTEGGIASQTNKLQIDSRVSVFAKNASTTPLVVQAATSQTANIQEWQNSSGTVLAQIGPGGIPNFPGAGASSTRIGSGSSAAGSSVVIGVSATDTGTYAGGNVIVGQGASASGTYGWNNVVIGQGASGAVRDSVLIGQGSSIAGNAYTSVVIGATATGTTNSVTIGYGASSNGGISIGTGATGVNYAIAIGQGANASDIFSVAMGVGAQSAGNGSFVWSSYGSEPTFVMSRSDSGGAGAGTFPVTSIGGTWTDNTHATRTGKLTLGAYYTTTPQYGITVTANSDGNARNALGITAITAPAAGSVPLTVKGAASQSGDLTQWQDSSGAILAKVRPSGAIEAAAFDTGGAMHVYEYGIKRGNGDGFVQFDSSGNPAVRIGGASGLSYTSTVRVESAGVGFPTLVVKAVASQTANIQEWQNTSGTVLGSIAADGTPDFPGSYGTSSLRVGAGSTAAYQNSVAFGPFASAYSNSVAIGSSVTAGGSYSVGIGTGVNTGTSSQNIVIGNFSNTSNYYSVINVGINNTTSGSNSTVVGTLSTAAGNSVAIGVYAVASGSNAIAIGYGSSATHTDSTVLGTRAASVSSGSFVFAGANSNPVFVMSRWDNEGTGTPYPVTSLDGSWSDNTHATRTGIASLGAYYTTTPQYGVTVTANSDGNARTAMGITAVTAPAAGSVPLTVKAATSQTADLQQWQNSSGTVLAKVDAAGNATFPSVTTTGTVFGTYQRTYALTRTLPSNTTQTVDVGTFAVSSGGISFEVHVSVSEGGYSVSKTYNFDASYALANWSLVAPETDTGPYSGHEFQLETAAVAGGSTSLRLRSADTTGGTAIITVMATSSDAGYSFTPSTTVATTTAPTTYWPNAIATQKNNVLTINGGNLQANYPSGNAYIENYGGFGKFRSIFAQFQVVYADILHDQASTQPSIDLAGTANKIVVYARTASQIPWVVQGAASQTSDLQQWQNSSATTLAGVQANGVPYAYGNSAVTTNTAYGVSALNANTSGTFNTGIGLQALYSNTTGYNNTAIGTYALVSNTTGYYNTASGYQSLYANTLGTNNTAYGHYSARNTTTGINNTTLGSNTLYSNTTGNNNTASGYGALTNNTTGSQNSGFGSQPLQQNTTGSYNTALGYLPLQYNTTGGNNIAIGQSTLQQNTTGSNSIAIGYAAAGNSNADGIVAIGYLALNQNTTGTDNVALGNGALQANTTGNQNVAVGSNALNANTTGATNNAFGYQALRYNTTGRFNCAFGSYAATATTTGNYNVGIGYISLAANTTADYNVSVGAYSLQVNTTGANNTSVGSNAMTACTTGSDNSAFGYSSLLSNTSGQQNAAYGREALRANTTGNYNLSMGSYSASSNTTGTYLTAVGHQAGNSNTTGTQNTYLGAYAGSSSGAAISNAVAIGYGANVQVSNGFVLGTSTTLVGIGTASPAYPLHVVSNAAGTVIEVVKAATSQTADLQQWQNASSTVLSGVAANGVPYACGGGNNLTNAAFGYNALTANSSQYNTAVGQNAMAANTSGGSNAAVGNNAMAANTSGSTNVAFGQGALPSNTTGSSNVAVGANAMQNNLVGSYNTAVGSRALFSNTADSNSAFGYYALNANTTGTQNAAFGVQALNSNTTGGNNSAFGTYALQNNTTGNYNTAVSYQALTANSTGDYNTAVGYGSMRSNTTGAQNCAFGPYALFSNTTGANNTAVGQSALFSNTTGVQNTASGVQALTANTTGYNNTALGYQTLQANTTGSHNIASGYQALNNNTTGSLNTASGYQALFGNSGGTNNVATGPYSLYNNTTGGYNTAVGYLAGVSNTTGTNNSYFGCNAGNASAATISNATAIGYNAQVQVTNGFVLGTSTSLVGIGTASPAYPLHTVSNAAGTVVQVVQAASSQTADLLQFQNSSATVLSGVAANGVPYAYGGSVITSNAAFGIQALRDNTAGINSAAFGVAALRANTTGNSNTAMGYAALSTNTTGSNNSAFGQFSLSNSTTGGDNTAFGNYTLAANTTGASNTAVGSTALISNTTGSSNTAVGFFSLYYNTTGSGNAAFGNNALLANTTANNNSAFGGNSLQNNTTGSDNTASGYAALFSNTTGGYNSAFGGNALYSNTTGSYNTALGRSSLSSNTTGGSNTAVGLSALQANTTGINNVATGFQSFSNSTTGNNNVGFGYQAGTSNTTGSNNSYFGNFAGSASAAGITGAVAIGYNAQVQVSNGFVLGTASTLVGIGTASPAYPLHVASNAVGTVTSAFRAATSQTADLTQWQDSSGTVLAKVNSAGAISSSDIRANNANGNPAVSISGYNTAWPTLAFNSYQGVTGQYIAGETGYQGLWQFDTGNGNLIYYTAGSTAQGANGSFTARTTTNQSGQLTVGSNVTYSTPHINLIGQSANGTDGGGGINIGDGGGVYYRINRNGTTNNTNIVCSRNIFTTAITSGFIGSSSSSPVLFVQGASSQTADLQQWYNSSGTVLAKVDASGNATFANIVTTGSTVGQYQKTYALSRTLPANTTTTVDIGTFACGSGAMSFELRTSVSEGGYSVSKTFNFDVDFGQAAWSVVAPITDGGPYGGHDFQLEATGGLSGGSTSLRLRSADTTGGTAYITVMVTCIDSGYSFTPSTTVATTTAPTIYWPSAVATQQGGVLKSYGNIIAYGNGQRVGIQGVSNGTCYIDIGDSSHSITQTSGQVMTYNAYHGHTFQHINTGTPVMIFKAATSQTADLQQWQNSSGTVLSGVAANGVPYAYGGGALPSNTAYGTGALNSTATGGSNNVAIGYQSLYSNTTNGSNTAVGYQSLYANIAYANSALGLQALYSNTTGTYNTATGYQSLYSNTTGANNAAFGALAGYANTTGGNNTYLGFYAGQSSSATISNATAIGYNAQATASNVVILGNGAKVGIGNTAPDFMLSLGANTASQVSSPDTISLGGTFSVTAGANPKLRLYWDGTTSVGIGISAGQMDYTGPSNSAHVFYVGSTERLRVGVAGVPTTISSGGAGTVVQVVKGAASQTADLQQWQNSSATVLAKVDSTGKLFVPTLQMSTGATNGYYLQSDASGNATWAAVAASVTSPAGSNTQVQYNASGVFGANSGFTSDTSGNVTVKSLTATLTNTDYTNTAGANSHLLMTNSSATGQNVVSSVINGSIVAKWRTDYVGNISWVSGGGDHSFYTGGDYGVGTAKMVIKNNGQSAFGPGVNSAVAQLDVISGSASRVAFIAKGAASQTANLQEWQDASGTVLTRIAANGDIYGSALRAPAGGTLSLYNSTNSVIFSAGSSYPSAQYGLYAGQLSVGVGGSYAIASVGYPAGGVIITNAVINSYNTGAASQIVQGIASQTANLTEWQNSSGTALASVSSAGGITAPTIKLTTGATNGYFLQSDASGNASWAAVSGGAGATNPAGSNTQVQYNASGVFGANSGFTSDTSGNVTVKSLTANLVNTDYTNTAGANSHLFLTNSSATNGHNSVTSVINSTVVGKWRTNYVGDIYSVAYAGGHYFYTGGDYGVGTAKLYIQNNGQAAFGGNVSSATGQLDVTSASASRVAFIAKGAASQTADLTQWQDSSGTVLSKVDSSGKVAIGTSALTDPLGIGTSVSLCVVNGTMTFAMGDYASGNGLISISNGTVKGFIGHINSSEGFVTGAYSSHGTVLRSAGNQSVMRLDTNGHVYIATIAGGSFTSQAGGQLQIDASSASTKGLIVKGAASQTGNLTEWQDSSGTVLASVAAAGGITAPTIKLTTGATNGYYLQSDASGNASWVASSGGITTPSGSNTQVQYNASGLFGANSGFTTDNSGNVTVNTLTTTHIVGVTAVTSFVAGSGAASGSGGNATGSAGTDLSGKIVINTGTSPPGNNTIVTVTFANAYASAPTVVFQACDQTTADFNTYAATTTTTFTLTTSVPLASSITYNWFYQVMG